mmetsp:Transcript_83053/g.240329  ORF Transcript_83053/g.240329 Transcript_83053/m.240329 type:complete len:225 (-) Transcript_83053:111-785(-)
MNTIPTLSYPRTGKRGVPQQFPRRLYEMLESETKLAEQDPDEAYVISWSESGKAFRITDVDDFAATVLPKYFRTRKFSSFQRNLNLYGFTKVRKGPDTDMYAHPSFVRRQPELLSELRKSTSASRRRASRSLSEDGDSISSRSSGSPELKSMPASSPVYAGSCFQPIALKTLSPQCVSHPWTPFQAHQLVLPMPRKPQVLRPKEETAKLDLLALVIERESCMSA